MAPIPTFYLLPPERVEPGSAARSWLGRIVQNHAAPDATFTPRNPHLLLSAHPTSETHLSDATAFAQGATRSSLSTRLRALGGATSESISGSSLRVEAGSIRYVRLQNHASALSTLSADPEVRAVLTHILWPGGEPAYLIVGMLIWEDAAFAYRREACNNIVASFAETPPELPTVAGLPAVSTEREGGRGRELTGFSEGSGIFAFEYRTVRRKVYSLGRNFKPRLGGYGGRIERDAVFGQDEEKMGKEERAKLEGFLMVDEEDVSWTDFLDDDELDIENICGVNVAFDT